MPPRDLPSPLLVVTDRHGSARPLADTVAACLDGGARWFWFRDRDMEPGERLRLGTALLRRIRDAGGRMVVGGDPALAAALGADGVHLGGGSRPEAVAATRSPGGLVGVSAHTEAEVAAAARAGADYATLSPIFPSASKPGYGPLLGPHTLADGRRHGLPVLALGGVGPDTLAACRAAGAAGAAIMGLPMRADDPAGAIRLCLAAWGVATGSQPSPSCPTTSSLRCFPLRGASG